MTAAPESIRTVVVDDESPSRARLAFLLRGEPDIAVVAECADGDEAVAAIEHHQPELVLLDIRLPGCDGFEVLARAQPLRPPHVIFITAHDEHAVHAFEVEALDYLLKPFDAERLHRALDRVREQRNHGEEGLRPIPMHGSDPPPQIPKWDRLAIRSHNRVLFLRPAEIDWIEAEGNYVGLHVGKQVHLLRETMHAAEQRLARLGFLRISRSALVNLDRVREMQPMFHGDAVLVLQDGQQLSVTRAYRVQLAGLL